MPFLGTFVGDWAIWAFRFWGDGGNLGELDPGRKVGPLLGDAARASCQAQPAYPDEMIFFVNNVTEQTVLANAFLVATRASTTHLDECFHLVQNSTWPEPWRGV